MATVARSAGVERDPDAAWSRLEALGARALDDRDGALGELAETFRAGHASAGIDGVTEGRFVAFAVRPALDRALARAARRVMPWSGKTFDAAAGRGVNRLLGGRVTAFGFATRVEASRLDPGHDVLAIDYAAVARNPRPLRQVRDELVEIAPGVHLGQALWKRRDGGVSLVAYWALRAS